MLPSSQHYEEGCFGGVLDAVANTVPYCVNGAEFTGGSKPDTNRSWPGTDRSGSLGTFSGVRPPT